MEGLAACATGAPVLADAEPIRVSVFGGRHCRASRHADIRPIPPPGLMESVFTDLIRFNRF